MSANNSTIILATPKENKSDNMTDARFWELVELAKWPCNHEKAKIMYRKLLSKEECKEFRKIKSKYYNRMDAYISEKDENELGVGDDGYNDLIHHIIGLGEDNYKKCINDFKLVEKLSETYKESFDYCIPYDSDYDEKTNPYTLKSILEHSKACIKELQYFDEMDKKGNYLAPINSELRLLEAWVLGFIITGGEKGLNRLIEEKKYVEKATKAIDKFFEDEYLELPRKFTERRKDGSDFHGMCTAMFNNLCYDAELVLEYIKEVK
jgi:hypothetical protein